MTAPEPYRRAEGKHFGRRRTVEQRTSGWGPSAVHFGQCAVHFGECELHFGGLALCLAGGTVRFAACGGGDERSSDACYLEAWLKASVERLDLRATR
jgi:hypothetical protein